MPAITQRLTQILFALLTPLACATAVADDWPQWRGPNRDGISKETGLLKDWPKDGPKLAWTAKDLGGGYGTPSIAAGRIFLMTNQGVEDESVKALDAKDARPLWSTRIGKVGYPNQQPSYPGARSTPTVDGTMLYAIGSDGDLACLDAATGKIQWQKNLRTDFGGKAGIWGYAESPLIDGDVLVCTPGGADATVLALDKKTGNVLWKSPIPGGEAAGYSSIMITETSGMKQYIAYTAAGLIGLDAKAGKFLWQYDKTKGPMGMSILTPVIHDQLIYTGSFGRAGGGGGAVKLAANKGSVSAEQAYYDPKLPVAIGGAVQVGGYLYGTNPQVLVCADFNTGQIKWTNRSAAPGALCYADGRLYLHAENGQILLIEATPQAYRELGRFTPPTPPTRINGMEKSWAYPVIANGKLYIRDTQMLWCYDISAP